MHPGMHDISNFLLDLYSDAQQCKPADFQRHTLTRLQDFVPFDFAAWGGGTADSREVTEVTMLNQSSDFFGAWGKVADRDAYCDLALARANRTVLFDDVPRFRDSFAYNEHWRRFDARNMIATIMAEPIDGYVTFIGLCASDPQRHYTEDHRATKQLLMPHVCKALRLNRRSLLEQIQAPGEGIAIVDLSGRVLAQRGPFWPVMLEEWSNTGGRVPAHVLPGHAPAAHWRGHAIQLRSERLGQSYVVRASLRHPLEKLTPREMQVAEQFSQGLSYKAVARTLNAAPATVRNHLARIYDKLGINTRAELVRICLGAETGERPGNL